MSIEITVKNIFKREMLILSKKSQIFPGGHSLDEDTDKSTSELFCRNIQY